MNNAVALPWEVKAARKSRSLNLSRIATAITDTTSAKLPPTSWLMKIAWQSSAKSGALILTHFFQSIFEWFS